MASVVILIQCSPTSVTVIPQWTIPPITLVAGSKIALSPTIPAGIQPGGAFGLAAGSVLPTGVSLSPDGVLSADADAPAGSVGNLVFTYAV